MPTREGESWGGSAPAQSNNFVPALNNNYHESATYGYTPVDYDPLSPWEDEGEADARNGRVLPADLHTPPRHGEQGGAAQMAALPQAAHSAAGQEHRPIKCGPTTAGPRQEDYADPYGDGQPLPKAPRKQLTKQILAELDSAALDAIQGEADGFPYHGSIRARNALFLDTELRSGSALVGFLRTARVDTLIGGTVDLATDPGALARVSNGVFFTAIRAAWANYQSLSSTMSSGPASTGVVSIRDPDVAKLEKWEPQAYLAGSYSMSMAFEYSMVTDLRQRARESGHLRKWQEEGNIVERWAKRCVSAGAGDPARGIWGSSSAISGLRS